MRVKSSFRVCEQWTLGLLRQSYADVVERGLHGEIEWLPACEDGFIADPHVVSLDDGRVCLFAEYLPYASTKGIIVRAVLESGGDFRQLRFEPVVEAPVHLSYPFVVRWDGRWLMLCESWEARGLLVFSADHPAASWRFERRILPGVPVVDPTLLYHDDLWWLFFSRQDARPNQHLQLMYASSPLGEWRPHPGGIVCDTLAGARPAGPIQRLDDGRLIRPGQDCSHTYGGALTLFEITRLDPTHYAERPLRTLSPVSPWPDGLHSLVALDDQLCLIDGKRWRQSPLNPWRFGLRYMRNQIRRVRGARWF